MTPESAKQLEPGDEVTHIHNDWDQTQEVEASGTVTPVDLDAARELCSEITKGTWEWDGDPCDATESYREGNAPWLVVQGDGRAILHGDIEADNPADVRFIPAARTLLPQCIDEIQSLRETVAFYVRAIRLRAKYKPEGK